MAKSTTKRQPKQLPEQTAEAAAAYETPEAAPLQEEQAAQPLQMGHVPPLRHQAHQFRLGRRFCPHALNRGLLGLLPHL